jgi:hypothetical protein
VQPLEVLHVLMALEVAPEGSTKYGNMLECYLLVRAQHGLAVFWNGFWPALLTNGLYRALYLFGVRYLMPLVLGSLRISEDRSFYLHMAVLHGVALCSISLVYPLETISRRLSAQAGRTKPQYRTMREAVAHIWREEGLAGFYAGGLIGILRTPLFHLLTAVFHQVPLLPSHLFLRFLFCSCVWC